MKIEWRNDPQEAPINQPVLVYDGQTIAVGRKSEYNTWFIDNSFGFNEDGEIYPVTHWHPRPEKPE